MKLHSKFGKTYFLPIKKIVVLAFILSVIVLMSFTFKNGSTIDDTKNEITNKDSIESVKAFMDVYKVLMSPRCMNCHPSGDVPLQGDDNHLHTMLPQRGKDGKGIYAMKCGNCHQPTNLEGLNKPPGNPNWHLPPVLVIRPNRRRRAWPPAGTEPDMPAGFPLLSWLIWLPIAGGLAVLAVGEQRAALGRWLALAVSVATFALSLLLWADFDRASPALQTPTPFGEPLGHFWSTHLPAPRGAARAKPRPTS